MDEETRQRRERGEKMDGRGREEEREVSEEKRGIGTGNGLRDVKEGGGKETEEKRRRRLRGDGERGGKRRGGSWTFIRQSVTSDFR